MKMYRVLFEASVYGEVLSKEMTVSEEELRELEREVAEIEGSGYFARLEVREVSN